MKVLSSLFEEFGEKTMARTSTFLEQKARHIRFHVEVVTKRKKEVFGVPKPSELSQQVVNQLKQRRYLVIRRKRRL